MNIEAQHPFLRCNSAYGRSLGRYADLGAGTVVQLLQRLRSSAVAAFAADHPKDLREDTTWGYGKAADKVLTAAFREIYGKEKLPRVYRAAASSGDTGGPPALVIADLLHPRQCEVIAGNPQTTNFPGHGADADGFDNGEEPESWSDTFWIKMVYPAWKSRRVLVNIALPTALREIHDQFTDEMQSDPAIDGHEEWLKELVGTSLDPTILDAPEKTSRSQAISRIWANMTRMVAGCLNGELDFELPLGMKCPTLPAGSCVIVLYTGAAV
jgi:hypothetical protein